jgi:predicted RNase H-like nuclease (RuvC/YqgF family)
VKGKHGQAAAVRQEVTARDTEIATYQRAVARLTAANKLLTDTNRERQRSWAKREREFRALIDQAASPTVDALQSELSRMRDKADNAERRGKQYREDFAKLAQRMVAGLMGDGMDYAGALREVSGIVGITVVDEAEQRARNSGRGDLDVARQVDRVVTSRRFAAINRPEIVADVDWARS